MKFKVKKQNNKVLEIILYSISFLLNKGGVYIFLPIYTRILSPELFGKYEMILTLFALLLPLGLMGIDSAMLRFFEDGNDKYNNKVYTIIGKLFTRSLILYIIISVLLFVFYQEIFNGSIFVCFSFIIRLSIDGINKIYRNRLRIEGDTLKYLFLDFINFIVSVVLTLVFLKIVKEKFLAILLALSFSGIVGFFEFIKSYIKIQKAQTGKNESLKAEIKQYSYPLTFNATLTWLLSLSDRLMIKFFLGYSSLGLYSAGFKVGALAQFITFGFGLLWPKWALEIKKKSNYEVYLSKVLNKILLVLILIMIFMYFGIKEIYPYIYPNNYQESLKIVPITILSFFLLGIDMISSVGFFYEKKSKEVLFSTIIATLVNVFLNLLLMRKYGYFIAALTTYISNLSLILIKGIFSYRYTKIKYNFKTIFLFLLLNLFSFIMR